MLLYFYDIKMKPAAYNTFKRRFYYHLGRSQLSAKPWRTKSVLLVKDGLEKEADAFFRRWKPYIKVFKAKVRRIEAV